MGQIILNNNNLIKSFTDFASSMKMKRCNIKVIINPIK